ncbi:MAG: rRNA maturation RNase YbeY [Patescibacteria group bacterium]|jgi:probable rRNA maturation factor
MAHVYVGYGDYGLEGVDDELIQFVFEIVVSLTKLDPESEAGLVMTTDAQMRDLNKKHRGIDKSTNILSFAYNETTPKEFQTADDKNYIGDIFISRAQLKKDAKAEKVSDKEKFVHLLTHGLLHLAGIHHKTKSQTVRMEGLEDKVIELVLSE